MSFLRTIVTCNSTGDDAGSGANFTGSAYCFNRTYVIGEATRTVGWVTAMSFAIKVVSAVILGIIADTKGRRPVMIAGTIGMCVGFVVLALNGLLENGTTVVMLTLASIIQSSLNPVTGGSTPFVIAQVADMSTEENRGVSMTSYAAVRTTCALIAFGVGYYILTLDLVDYTYVWAAFAGLAFIDLLLYIFLVPETLHEASSTPSDEDSKQDSDDPETAITTTGDDAATKKTARQRANSQKAKVIRSSFAAAIRKNPCTGWCIVFRSAFLALFMFSCLLTFWSLGGTYFVVTGYMMSQMGWVQSSASLALCAQTIATLIGYVLNYWTVAVVRGDVYTCFGIGTGLAGLGNLVIAVASPYHVSGFWIGFMLLGVAYGYVLPAMPSIASRHADPEEQAQLQATFTIANFIGIIAGSELHTNIYDEFATGVLAGTPFIASTALLWTGFIVFVIVRSVSAFFKIDGRLIIESSHLFLTYQAYHVCRKKTSVSSRRQRDKRYRAITRAVVTQNKPAQKKMEEKEPVKDDEDRSDEDTGDDDHASSQDDAQDKRNAENSGHDDDDDDDDEDNAATTEIVVELPNDS